MKPLTRRGQQSRFCLQSLDPLPIWLGALRYWPLESFPAYRHVPGLTPHPERHPKGHSYKKVEVRALHLSEKRWGKNFHFLFGIDLYHQGYLWEAHAVWETLWKADLKKSGTVALLKGLIQNAAALLKLHQHNFRGAESLSRRARRYVAAAGGGIKFGIDLDSLANQMDKCYAPLWTAAPLEVKALFRRAPKIALQC